MLEKDSYINPVGDIYVCEITWIPCKDSKLPLHRYHSAMECPRYSAASKTKRPDLDMLVSEFFPSHFSENHCLCIFVKGDEHSVLYVAPL